MKDANGTPLHEGMNAHLLHAPAELLRGLPREDQEAIQSAVNTATMLVVGSDDHGNVELEFDDANGTRHWIVVPPAAVALLAPPAPPSA